VRMSNHGFASSARVNMLGNMSEHDDVLTRFG